MKKLVLFFALFGFAILSLFSASTLYAQSTFNVNSTIDAIDANVGDGICEITSGSGECTLRAAIQEANSSPIPSVIQLPNGYYSLTIAGKQENLGLSGDIDILNDVQVVGESTNLTIVDGNELDRVFDIRPGSNRTTFENTIQGLTITGGLTDIEGQGGGVRAVGNTLEVHLHDVIVMSNVNNTPSNITGGGGGIYNDSNLHVTDSIIEANSSNGTLSGGGGHGGGIYSRKYLNVSKSKIINNSGNRPGGSSGGGILVSGGILELDGVTIENNFAQSGAGIYIRNITTPGNIQNSTLSNNGDPNNTFVGGAINSASYPVNVTNSTISGNAVKDFGGGILGGNLNLLNVTFSSNQASRAVDIKGGGSGITVANTIFDSSAADSCEFLSNPNSLGHNLASDASCLLNSPSDLEQISIHIGLLSNNGGSTLTHALLLSSPAIDYGDDLLCPTTDQRGILRPQGNHCDVGAYEAIWNQPPTSNAGPDQTAFEGDTLTFDGSGSTDPDGIADIVSYEWDFGDGSTASGQIVNHIYINDGVYTTSLTVTDSAGETDSGTATITIDNADPILGSILAPVDPIETNTQMSASASFSDDGIIDVHTATWDWGDGSVTAGTVNESFGSGTVADLHTYSTPGVYEITLTLNDDDGGTATQVYQYVVVYDPSGGFVTGAGRFDSPAGAYQEDLGLTGMARFGFNSKYQNGANVPTGNTRFVFKLADLKFESSTYDWLVVAGSRAQFKGTGTINGVGNYGFFIVGIDGSPDKFRIKIWDKDDGDVLIYDNQINEDDNSNNATELSAGSIVIHP